MLYIGVDLSDKHFDSCMTNSYGDVLSRNRFDFDDDGFRDRCIDQNPYISRV